MTPGFDEGEYRNLLADFPPRPIEDEAHLEETESRLWELLVLDKRTPAQETYLGLLSGLVRHWEDAHVTIPPLTGTALVRALLAERGLPQRDLAPLFGAESIVSEVLNGKRELQAKHIARLATFFHVSPAAFFAVEEAQTSAVPA